MAEIYPRADRFDPLPENPADDPDASGLDARAHEETWSDMMRCQSRPESGYPAAFERIRGPVIMLHGAFDPHPGMMIRATLARVMPQIEYREWERCGHYPWLESRPVGNEFFAVLREWLARNVV
ncbi:MAG: hypothetical protein NTZ61_00020 [Proteobacteria bacterium]|nr:hypothetical protein [Pseudomonadota bacterium]